jgi:hypothetical protein
MRTASRAQARPCRPHSMMPVPLLIALLSATPMAHADQATEPRWRRAPIKWTQSVWLASYSTRWCRRRNRSRRAGLRAIAGRGAHGQGKLEGCVRRRDDVTGNVLKDQCLARPTVTSTAGCHTKCSGRDGSGGRSQDPQG